MSTLSTATIVFRAICRREFLKFSQQYARLLSALARPLVWLVIFAAGFRSILGVSIVPPYQTYITYDVYVVPGLCTMVLMFFGMQTSLSMVYDREMGTMRLLMTAPFPRPLLLLFRLISTGFIGVLQVYAFLFVAMLMGIEFELLNLFFVAPLLLLVAILFGALGFLLSLTIRQLENFAGVMNFVIFPSFFLSSALYPLWRIQESSPLLAEISFWNPFTHAVEAIRYQLYGDFKTLSVVYLIGVTCASLLTVMFAYAKRDVMKTP